MKKSPRIICFFCLGAILSVTVTAQSNTGIFTGFWVLDREKTNTSKDFPIQLKDYKMLIGEDQDRLMVKAQVVGNVEIRVQQVSTGGVMSTSGSRTTTANPNGIMATTGSSPSGTSTSKANYGGTMALYFTPPEITYDLRGKELRIEPTKGDKINGLTRIKAKVGKDGKTMEFTTIRQMKGSQGEVETTTRETWRISDDGQSLKFHRTIETPILRDEITMVLIKKPQ